MNVTMSMEEYQEMKDKIRILEEKEKQFNIVVNNIENTICESKYAIDYNRKHSKNLDMETMKYYESVIILCKSLACVNLRINVPTIEKVNLLEEIGGLR